MTASCLLPILLHSGCPLYESHRFWHMLPAIQERTASRQLLCTGACQTYWTYVHAQVNEPPGTYFWHGHSGSERVDGLTGPLIVRPKPGAGTGLVGAGSPGSCLAPQPVWRGGPPWHPRARPCPSRLSMQVTVAGTCNVCCTHCAGCFCHLHTCTRAFVQAQMQWHRRGSVLDPCCTVAGTCDVCRMPLAFLAPGLHAALRAAAAAALQAAPPPWAPPATKSLCCSSQIGTTRRRRPWLCPSTGGVCPR
jgi:hypothetical protein